MQGGTFTITNPGTFGAQFGMPIINQPQVAILGIGAIEKRAVVGDDEIADPAAGVPDARLRSSRHRRRRRRSVSLHIKDTLETFDAACGVTRSRRRES